MENKNYNIEIISDIEFENILPDSMKMTESKLEDELFSCTLNDNSNNLKFDDGLYIFNNFNNWLNIQNIPYVLQISNIGLELQKDELERLQINADIDLNTGIGQINYKLELIDVIHVEKINIKDNMGDEQIMKELTITINPYNPPLFPENYNRDPVTFTNNIKKFIVQLQKMISTKTIRLYLFSNKSTCPIYSLSSPQLESEENKINKFIFETGFLKSNPDVSGNIIKKFNNSWFINNIHIINSSFTPRILEFKRGANIDGNEYPHKESIEILENNDISMYGYSTNGKYTVHVGGENLKIYQGNEIQINELIYSFNETDKKTDKYEQYIELDKNNYYRFEYFDNSMDYITLQFGSNIYRDILNTDDSHIYLENQYYKNSDIAANPQMTIYKSTKTCEIPVSTDYNLTMNFSLQYGKTITEISYIINNGSNSREQIIKDNKISINLSDFKVAHKSMTITNIVYK